MNAILNFLQPDDDTLFTLSDTDILENVKELCSEIIKKYTGMAVLVGAFYANISTVPVTISSPKELLDATELVYGCIEIPSYKKTLDRIRQLSPDWDGYDAPVIDKDAIAHCDEVLSRLSTGITDIMTILPTELGGVQIKYQTKGNSIISCEFGNERMSYYIDVPGQKTNYNDFLTYSGKNINTLVRKIRTLA